MKTNEELKTRIKELSKQAVTYSKAAVESENLDDKRQFRRQAMETSKRFQVLIGELIRRQTIA